MRCHTLPALTVSGASTASMSGAHERWTNGPLSKRRTVPKLPAIHGRISIKDDARGSGTHGLRMTRAELIEAASPPCHECGAPVQRVETPWHLDEDGRWRAGPYFMVCGNEHRVLVEPLV
jgi:hypothetical protein